MITYTNAKVIEDRTKAARRASLGGLVIMMPGLFLGIGGLINPALQDANYIMISYVSLILGTIVATFGGRMAEQWLIEPRDDQKLEKTLKRLDKRYRLLNFHTPADHLLLTPTGLYVIVMRDKTGPVRYDGKRWSQPPSLGRLWSDWRHGGLGDPSVEAAAQIKKLQAWLKDNGAAADGPISPLVVFSKPGVDLKLPAGCDDVFSLDELREYLGRHTTPAIASAQYRALAEAITPASAEAQVSEDEGEAEPAPAVSDGQKQKSRRKRRRPEAQAKDR